uniref:NADH dehydrogenase subunit 4L n=1 Tax=Haltichella nipponensis TaxID=2907788 RepID=UPI001EE057F1|nr:NADH dehydrogenase subunit 4L [Haltichella nipponensis]UIB40567.1 NADH dehydrogenase subunit 4L [Haltichella nipponensis]
MKFLMIFMFIFFFILFCMNLNNVISEMIILEMIMISMLMLLTYLMYELSFVHMILYYLVFVVCESVLGLSIMLVIIRSKGNDNLKVTNMILW